ncbi:MAG: cytochrome c assembly protein [Acidimicrobiaceae bacterium]|jgi:heme exporter protein C|nr:cytochrome c assembly protein [Acidimicrobiaceae bacterium]
MSLVTTPVGLDSAPPPGAPAESGTSTSARPPAETGRSRSALVLRLVGAVALVGVVATVWLGLWVTPPDQFMGNLVRLLYLHPSIAWVMYVAYGVAFLSSLLYLWPRTRSLRWDKLAGASSEVGVVFTGLTLVTGSIWGRPTWGAWWTWDPLLTTTALLFVLYLGYLAVRRIPGDSEVRARRSAIAALIAFVDVPICYFSVLWWRSLHQAPSVDDPVNGKTYIHGSMAWTLLLSFVSFTLVYVWLLVHRYRLFGLAEREEGEGLALAIEERRAESQVPSR